MKTTGVLLIGRHKRASYSRPITSFTDPNTRNGSRLASGNISQRNHFLNSTMPRFNTSFHKPSSTLNDPEMLQMRNDLFLDGKFSNYSDKQIFKFIAHLREYKTECAVNEEYDEAQNCLKLIEEAKSELQNRKKPVEDKKKIEDNTLQEQKTIIDHYNNKIKEVNESAEQQINELKKQQEKEWEEFENVWATEKPRKYRKPSTELLNLKEKEKSSALTRDYATAEILHQEAAEMINEERNEQQKRLRQDYLLAKKQMEEKHKKEIDGINMVKERKLAMLIVGKQKRISELENRKFVLKRKSLEINEKERSDPNNIQPIYGSFSKKAPLSTDNLLGELIPPNDKQLQEDMRRHTVERRRMQEEYQKKNAERTLGCETPQPHTSYGQRKPMFPSRTTTSHTKKRRNLFETPNGKKDIKETTDETINENEDEDKIPIIYQQDSEIFIAFEPVFQ